MVGNQKCKRDTKNKSIGRDEALDFGDELWIARSLEGWAEEAGIQRGSFAIRKKDTASNEPFWWPSTREARIVF